MSCDDTTAINVNNIGKFFEIYEKPVHRLLQMLYHGRKQFYRPYWALSDISFNVGHGECFGIIGRNGAGKSTLLQIITGTLTPSVGTVSTQGRVAALLELGSGFNPEFTGRENVYLNASILGLSKIEIDEKYEAIINFADIGDFIDQPVKSYSSGMVVRLAFAVIAHVDADILIIDEALSVGDAFFTQKCMRFLRRFMESNTVLFVSHDVASVNSLCTRAMLLEKGCIKLIGSPKEITEAYLEDLYEAIQGKNEMNLESESPSPQSSSFEETDFLDMRQNFINCSNLRNDLEVFQFNTDCAAFGKGGAVIENTFLTDQTHGRPLNWVVGGELVSLTIICRAHQDLFRPTVGFYIKDRFGQILIGDNTYLAYENKPLYVAAGNVFKARFSFRMPILAAGDYSFTVAIAEGTQSEHIQHEWRHDAILLTSVSTSVSTGLMGIPMNEISLEIIDENSRS